MFTTTFYSYKGGVGRTIALANVASELARRGKSVLLADFDLEAPGLSSFAFNGQEPLTTDKPGLVDFITEWLRNGESPDVTEFVYRHDSDRSECAPIWVMPAGQIDKEYGTKFRQIDFQDLYEKHDGYLLFEDLKAQWRNLGIDYVLIDSRTGHTDVGGICLRQMPDLVIFVFWPNVQNLDGLSAIISELEEEEKESKRTIAKVFVPSNLPTIDDEDEVLQKLLTRFRKELSYSPDQEIKVHNYPSLELLEQKIFTVCHPRSRLSSEYRKLTSKLMENNLQDESGVALYLNGLVDKSRRFAGSVLTESLMISNKDMAVVDNLFEREWSNSDVNRILASVKARDGNLHDAMKLINKVLESSTPSLNDYLRATEWALSLGQHDGNTNNIEHLLNDEDSGPRHIIVALRSLARMPPTKHTLVIDRPAINKLSASQLSRVVRALTNNRGETYLMSLVISNVLQKAGSTSQEYVNYRNVNVLALSLISGGAYDQAVRLLEQAAIEEQSDLVRRNFNLAMARWGIAGYPDEQEFREFLAHSSILSTDEINNPNVQECLALAHSIVGNVEDALAHIELSREKIGTDLEHFSCWSYLERSSQDFRLDLCELEKRVRGEHREPAVFVENAGKKRAYAP